MGPQPRGWRAAPRRNNWDLHAKLVNKLSGVSVVPLCKTAQKAKQDATSPTY